jgi:S1-C subfamily serine protease
MRKILVSSQALLGDLLRTFLLVLLVSAHAIQASAQTSSTNNLSIGTGFVVADGLMVTAAHVLRDKDSVWVGPIEPKRWLRAQVVKIDPLFDLALIAVKLDAPALSLARWSDVPNGLEVFVVGFPQPRLQGLSKKITQGLINGNRSDRNESFDSGYFQFSAEVQQGNSGGPILAPDGLVVGMVQKKLNALSVAEKTNDLPVNVSYGLKSSEIVNFLVGTPAQASVSSLSLRTVLRPYQVFAQHQGSIFAVVGRKSPAAPETPSP